MRRWLYKLKLNQDVEFYLTGRKKQTLSRQSDPISTDNSCTDGIWWVKREAPTIKMNIAVLAQSKIFKPGATVQYEVKIGKRRKGITIPFDAVYQNENEYSVYLKNGQRKLVKVGSRLQNRIEIVDGQGKAKSYFDQK